MTNRVRSRHLLLAYSAAASLWSCCPGTFSFAQDAETDPHLTFGKAPCFAPEAFKRYVDEHGPKAASAGANRELRLERSGISLGKIRIQRNERNLSEKVVFFNRRFKIDVEVTDLVGVEIGSSDHIRSGLRGFIETTWMIFWAERGGKQLIFEIEDGKAKEYLLSIRQEKARPKYSTCKQHDAAS